MLGNNRGRNFDLIEDGRTVLSVRYLNHDEPVQCCICERPTFSTFCVPFYCGAVREGCSEGGYNTACERCYARWERWNDAGMARLRKPAHGGYPAVPRGATPWDASQIKPPGWHHVEAAFIEGAREARANPEADEAMFRRAADGHTKRVFEEVDPVSEAALRTESWKGAAGAQGIHGGPAE